jgi:hypothetical protein
VERQLFFCRVDQVVKTGIRFKAIMVSEYMYRLGLAFISFAHTLICWELAGMVKQFAGAMCTHWTTDNKTERTRVSLDFRIIPGHLFHRLKGGQLNNYHRQGHYSRCVKSVCTRTATETASTEQDKEGNVSWLREGPFQPPDARNGFPWTVKDWDTFWSQTKDKK